MCFCLIYPMLKWIPTSKIHPGKRVRITIITLHICLNYLHTNQNFVSHHVPSSIYYLSWVCHIFHNYLINSTILRKHVIDIKCMFWSPKFLSYTDKMNFLYRLLRAAQHKISWKSIQWEPCCSTQAYRQTEWCPSPYQPCSSVLHEKYWC